MAISDTGFISTVNTVAENLSTIQDAVTYFDADTIVALNAIDTNTINEATNDLKKGNYLGYRKLDLDLTLNYENGVIPTGVGDNYIEYDSASITLRDGTLISIPFKTVQGDPVQYSSAGDISSAIQRNQDFIDLVEYSSVKVNEAYDEDGNTQPDTYAYIRITDTPGFASNIQVVQLHVSGSSQGLKNDAAPAYTWVDTTSALQVLGGNIANIVSIGENTVNINIVSDLKLELETLAPISTDITTVYNNIPAITTSNANAANINIVATDLDLEATTGSNIITVSDNITQVGTIHTNILNILAVDANEANINAAVANATNINTVSGNTTNINTLAGISGDITTVATNDANVTIVADNTANINAVVANKPSIDVVAGLGADVTTVAGLAADIPNILAIEVSTLDPIITNLTPLVNIGDNLTEILLADDNATIATTQAGIATTKATEAAASAAGALDHLNDITGLTTSTSTLVPGSSATASYNSTSGVLSLGIPTGATGSQGPAFSPDASGAIASRSTYDSEAEGFAYLSTDEAQPLLYFRSTATAGVWTTGVPFGKGETGAQGFGWLSGVGAPLDANGVDGDYYLNTSNADVYSKSGGTWSFTINLTPVIDDAGTAVNKVWSSTKISTELGLKSDATHNHDLVYEPINANIQTHIADLANPHGVTKAQIGLSAVDNTSDANKPVSTATADAIANIQATAQNNAVGLSIVFGS